MSTYGGITDYYVFISGLDDTHLHTRFSEWEEALALYNSITYIQSYRDLTAFLESIHNNGWPGERAISQGRYPWSW
jgi:hypothetical protein